MLDLLEPMWPVLLLAQYAIFALCMLLRYPLPGDDEVYVWSRFTMYPAAYPGATGRLLLYFWRFNGVALALGVLLTRFWF